MKWFALLLLALTSLAWGQQVNVPSSGSGGTPGGPAGGDLTGTYPNPTVATVSGAGAVANAALASMAANTVKGNITGSSAAPTDVSLPTCTDTGGQHLNYSAGFICGTSSGGGISGLTINTIPKATSPTTIGNSSVIDTGTGPTQTPNGLDLVQSGLGDEYTVDTGGVTANKLACRSSTNKVVICPVNATTTVLGVALSTVTSGGTVKLCFIGKCSVVSSNNFTAGNWAIPSASVAGDIDDTGSTSQPTTGTQTFLEQSTGSAGAQVVIDMLTPDTLNATGGGKAITPNSTITAIPYLSAANVYSDAPLFRLNANTIEQHNSTTSQTLNVYQSYTSSTTNHGISIAGSTISTFANGADVPSALTINSGAGPFSLSLAALPVIQLGSTFIKFEEPITVFTVNANTSVVASTAGAGGVFIAGNADLNAIASASQTNTVLSVGGSASGAGSGGTYEFSWLLQCQTAVAGAQVTATISWVDRNSVTHNRSITLDASNTANEVSSVFLMNVKANQTISVTTIITNGGGTAAYDARYFLKQME